MKNHIYHVFEPKRLKFLDSYLQKRAKMLENILLISRVRGPLYAFFPPVFIAYVLLKLQMLK